MTRVALRYGTLALFLVFTPFIRTTQSQNLDDAIKLTRSEQFNAAEKLFSTILAANPTDGDIYFYYGDNYLKRYFADTLNTSLQEMTNQAQTLFAKGIRFQTTFSTGSMWLASAPRETMILLPTITNPIRLTLHRGFTRLYVKSIV